MEPDYDNTCFQLAFNLIQKTNQSFFLTGKAGTGKSTFLKYVVDTIDKNFVVVAPTGIAAINVGGVTIHSFFQFPLRPLLPEDEGIKLFREGTSKRRLISKIDTLIIDEVSMVRADLMDGIDYSLRINGGDPNLPFGGKQIIFIGDIFQLAPVTIKDTGEHNIIKELYKSPYFFNAMAFNKLKILTIELQKVYRQNDTDFINLLDKVRTNEILQSDLNRLNECLISDSEINNLEFVIALTTRNDSANKVNLSKLSNIKSKPYRFIAKISDEFDESKYPTTPELILKNGAQVIFIKNDNDKRWVNGTIGQIYELSDFSIKVQLIDGTIYTVEKTVWENVKYQYNKEKQKIEQEIVGTFEQYPLKLAWAITIHKSQGLTFEKVVIDFGEGTFAGGQAYVALSRVTSFKGLFLKQKIRPTDIYIDEEIKDFLKIINDRNYSNEKFRESIAVNKQNTSYH